MVAASGRVPRRSTCGVSIRSACWCSSTAYAGSTSPPPRVSAAAPTSTRSRCRSSITSRSWKTARPQSMGRMRSRASSTSSPARRSTASNWNPNNPVTNTYHHFTNSDRFNYAPFNLLSTPSERKSIFMNLTYNASEDVELYFKGLFNNRQSANQAAPEPIFVGPSAGTGGLADTISVAANNPYNPFGFALDAATNFRIGRRPIEVGPRIFTQDVNTYYFSTGFKGTLHV